MNTDSTQFGALFIWTVGIGSTRSPPGVRKKKKLNCRDRHLLATKISRVAAVLLSNLVATEAVTLSRAPQRLEQFTGPRRAITPFLPVEMM